MSGILELSKKSRAWDLILAEEMANVIAEALRPRIIAKPKPPTPVTPPQPLKIELPPELLEKPTIEKEVIQQAVPIGTIEGNDEIGERPLTISQPTTLITIEGQGIIREFSFLSDRSDLTISLYKDQNIIFRKTFQELMQLSPFYSFLIATSFGDQYIFGLKDIRFVKNFKVEVVPKQTTRITIMYNYRLAEIPGVTAPSTITIGK